MPSTCADPSLLKYMEQTSYQCKSLAKRETKIFPVSQTEPLNSGCLHRNNIKQCEETALYLFSGFFEE